jgi:putative membrane protein
MKMLIRFVISAVALWVAAEVFPGSDGGIRFTDDNVTTVLLVAVVFGLVNMFIKPIVKLLSLPARILTLGLFGLIINTAMLALTALVMDQLEIDGFVPAFLGALVISVISAVLGFLVPDDE